LFAAATPRADRQGEGQAGQGAAGPDFGGEEPVEDFGELGRLFQAFLLMAAERRADFGHDAEAHLVRMTQCPSDISVSAVVRREGPCPEEITPKQVAGAAAEQSLDAGVQGDVIADVRGIHHEGPAPKASENSGITLGRAGQGLAGLVDKPTRADDDVSLCLRTRLHELQQMLTLDGVAGGADVDPVALGRGDAFVPRLIEAAVAVDEAQGGMAQSLGEVFTRTVLGAAIHDDDFVRNVQPSGHLGDMSLQQRPAIIGRDDDAYGAMQGIAHLFRIDARHVRRVNRSVWA